jgi:transcriptional regulator with PAS, ATPase and Fis domain
LALRSLVLKRMGTPARVEVKVLEEHEVVRLGSSEPRPVDVRLHESAKAALRAHLWPGNVRELKNAMLRAAATAIGR